MQKHGVVILTDTPHDTDSENRQFYESLADKLRTRIYTSMYGDIWDTAGEFGNETSDTAYTNLHIAPHTDLNYVTDTPKYQVPFFTCLTIFLCFWFCFMLSCLSIFLDYVY